ncbi:P-loop containing nucleoside triphosphate hydrolase protein [Trichoderma ceciliae]
MYARYIPPTGGQKPLKSNEESSVTKQSPGSLPAYVPPTATNGDGLSYSRYIPGAKAQQQSELPIIQRFEEEPKSPNPKRKRDEGEQLQEARNKKSKKSKKEKQEKQDNDSLDSRQQDLGAEEVEGGTRRSSKREGRKMEESEAVLEEQEFAEEEERKPKKSRKSEKDSDLVKRSKEEKKKDKKNGAASNDVDDDESASSEVTSTEEPKTNESISLKKENRRRERDIKKDQSPEQVDVENATALPKDTEMADVDPTAEDGLEAPESDQKRQKKAKKEKKKKSQDVNMDDAPEEEEQDKRHRAVFERKAKSLRYAEIIKEQGVAEEPEEPAELHGLEALPQPEPAARITAKPTYETLPSWLSAPIRVSQDTRTPFADLGILPKAARVLEQKGYTEAFAVQTAALPLLLPTNKQQPGDLLVSAATGSGKTLAYALPIVRDLSNGVITRLRALVVLPTRELVKQAQEVFELCAKAYEGEDRKRVRIGIAIGNQSLALEQDLLITKETRYDPETYKRLEQEASHRTLWSGTKDDLDELLTGPDTQRSNPRLGAWQGQVTDFHSKVDILICTPGRLVEHIDQTPGFTLSYIRWLVVDEADKLLAQSFQGWLDVVLDKFKINHFGARDFPDMAYSGVRKILLSATLTRDLSLLNQLALRRPKLILLESGSDAQVAEHSLPELLREHAVRIHDANLKPLYLLDLLRSRHMAIDSDTTKLDVATEAQSDSSSETSSDDSGPESESGSDTSSYSDTSSDSDSDADSSASAKKPRSQPCNLQTIPRSLIFTKSNEAALRLSRLLVLLDKSLATQISTLTSTTPTSIRRKTLRAFTTPSSSLRLIIASDLVARGIDIPKLPHVINYDLPPSVAGYVHRVGRTARAGRSGCAWTLVGDGESGWFWGKIGKGAGVKRAQKVDRVMIEEMSEERIEEYEDALEKLGKEALESRKW